MSSSVHVDNKKKYISVLGKDPPQGLEHTLTAEKMYSINFTEHNKMFWLCVIMEQVVIYLLMVKKYINNKCSFFTLCIVLFSIIFTINVRIGTHCLLEMHDMNRDEDNVAKYDSFYQKTI